MHSRRGFAVAVFAAALAIPSAAQAAVRCVPATGPGCDASYATIGGAVTAASNDDTIKIAAGTYAESISTTKRLSFVGAGAGATTIAPTGNAALILSRGGSVSALRAVGADGVAGHTAVALQPDVDGSFAYVLDDVVGVGGNGTFWAGGPGLSVRSGSAAKVVSLSVSGGSFAAGSAPGLFQGDALALNGPGLAATISNASATGPSAAGGDGFVAGGGATVDTTGLRATGYRGAQLGDSTVALRRSVIGGRAAGVEVYDSLAATPTAVTLLDDLITATPTAAVDAAALSAGTALGGSAATVTVRGSTIVAGGVDPQYAVVARPAVGAPAATIDMRNSIARLTGAAEAGEADVAADGGGVTVSHSDLAKSLQLNGGSVTALGSILSALPLFDSGAFTLQPASPLIDGGDPAGVGAGELDLAGRPRAVDYDGDGVAQPDLGAYELPAPPPRVEPPPPVVVPPAARNARPRIGKVSMTNRVFAPERARGKGAGAADVNRARARVRRGTTFRYLLSERARVTIAIERRARGRRARARARGRGRRCLAPGKRHATGRPCIRWVRSGSLRSVDPAGLQSLEFSGRLKGRGLKPGRYRARMVARDAAGSRSPEKRISFKVVRAR